MRVGGWDRFQEMIQNNEFDFGALPIAGYYFYLISLLPDNHFLPFFTILISYGCMMLIIYKVAQRYKVDKLNLSLSYRSKARQGYEQKQINKQRTTSNTK